jgi:hypothetical protein
LKNKLYNKINNIDNNNNNKNNNINFIKKIKKRPKSNFSLRSNRSSLNKSLNNNFNSNNNINNNIINNDLTLFINIYSNWGNSSKICINNIKFFNKENKEILYINSNITNFPFISKYHKSEIKKIFFTFNQNILSIKFIEILNGFNDLGIKNIQIYNEKNKNIWKGVIRKINQITNKTHKIEILYKNSIYKKISPKYSSQIILHSNNNNLNKNSNSNSNFNRTLSNNNSKINNIFINNNNNSNNKNNSNIKIKYYSPFHENKKISKIEKNSQESIINYEICNKIKFNLISNYGNSFYIGLT